jgi:hypothetical protein
VILLWGLPNDTPLALVAAALDADGQDVAFLDQRRVLEMQIEVEFGATIAGEVKFLTRVIDLRGVVSMYLRPYETERMPRVRAAGVGGKLWAHARGVDDTLLSWADLAPTLVVNRPSAMASNGSKPYQGMLAQRAGFWHPETLMTTDPDVASDFAASHRSVIYKSISGVRSKISRLTNDARQRMDDIRWCPTQFQEYVPGDDFRIHVVGEQVFACRIASTADDYRYAVPGSDDLKISSCSISEDVTERSIRLTREMGLVMSGLDLRRHPDGRWYCFEVNPSPGFSYFQAATDQPIAEAVADLLERRN